MKVPYVGPLRVSFQARICAEEQERGLHRFWAWREQQLQLVEANASDFEKASRLCAQNQPSRRAGNALPLAICLAAEHDGIAVVIPQIS